MKRSTRFQRPGLLGGSTANTLLDADGPQPSLNLDLASGILDPRIDFQRTTVGTYYRGQFNQNSLLQSQSYTTWWSRVTSTVVSSTVTAPDGTATASEILTSGTGDYIAQNQTPVLGLSYTASGYFKAGTATLVFIVLVNFPNTVVEYNLSTGVSQVTTGSADAHGMIDVGNGWWRCWVTKTYSGTGTVAVRYASADSNAVSSYNLWGAQLTEGSLLTPYIPTTTAAITEGQIASSQPWNLLLRSQEFDVSPWAPVVTGAGVSPVVTANAAVAPDGTTTADQIDFNCGGLTASDRSIRRQLVTLTAGQTYTLSSWVRSATGSTQTVQMTAGAATLEYQVDGNWQRLSYTFTSTGGSTGIGLELRGNNTAGVTTSSIYVWGMQLNEGSSALDYRSTTSSALWLPRFENDPITGEARGLLIEGGATNLCLQSADLATTWTNQSSTDSTNVITAPDGTVSADSFTDVAASAVHGMYQLIAGQSTTATYTTSCFVKKGSVRYLAIGHWTSATDFWGVSVDMDNPTSSGLVTAAGGVGYSVAGATITNVGNGWYRVSVTGVSPTTNHYPTIAHRTTQYSSSSLFESYAGSTANFTYVWGFQYEQQAFASSYIPTTTTTVARGLDGAVMTGTNFSSWYNQSEGTIYASVYSPTTTPAAGYGLNDNTSNNRMNFGLASGTLASNFVVVTSTASQANLLVSGTPTIRNTAFAYRTNDFSAVVNGSAPATDLVGTVPAVTQLQIGGNTSFRWNSTIRQMAYWPTRLPDATLQSLTA